MERPQPLPSLRIRPAAGTAGDSWLGGTPRVPAGFEWPEYETGPMAFLAQIALADVHAALPDAPLPADGWLLFFYDQEASHWEEEGSGRVVHVRGDASSLERRTPPPGAVEPGFPVRAVVLEPELTLPSRPDLEEPEHRLLGYPTLVQDPPETGGRPLLLQLDTDLDGGMMWGDAGRLYFFAREPEDALAVLQST